METEIMKNRMQYVSKRHSLYSSCSDLIARPEDEVRNNGSGSLGFDFIFPRRLADRKVLCCKSDKPPCRRDCLGGT